MSVLKLTHPHQYKFLDDLRTELKGDWLSSGLKFKGQYCGFDYLCEMSSTESVDSLNLALKPKSDLPKKKFYLFKIPEPTPETQFLNGWLKSKSKSIPRPTYRETHLSEQAKNAIKQELDNLVIVCKKIDSGEIKFKI